MATQPVESSYTPEPFTERRKLSVLHGPVDPPLVDLTLGELLELQCQHHGTQEALVTPWNGTRWTYNELNQQSGQLARALMSLGIGVGDRVAVMAGNCAEYAAIFFAVARIGAILVILNNTYTPTEAQYALKFSGKIRPGSRRQSADHTNTEMQTPKYFSRKRRSVGSIIRNSWASWPPQERSPVSSSSEESPARTQHMPTL